MNEQATAAVLEQPSLLSVHVDLKNAESRVISIDANGISYARFVRQLLRRMRIPMKNSANLTMRMNHMGTSVAVDTDHDLAFIIRGSLLCEEPISVQLHFSSSNPVSHEGKHQIQFNEEGYKISQEFAMNEPSDPRYKPKAKKNGKIMGQHLSKSGSSFTKDESLIEEDRLVSCAFCKENINELEYIKKLGWFYGPYKMKKKDYYTHLMCAVWSPAVFLHEQTNRFQNIRKEISRSSKIICKACGLFGASLGCFVKDCKSSYHFKCALSDEIDTRIDHEQYVLYCSAHCNIYDDRIAEKLQNVHCEKCQDDENEHLILLCDNCDKAYHTFCLANPLHEVPDGDWFCPECPQGAQQQQEKHASHNKNQSTATTTVLAVEKKIESLFIHQSNKQ